MTKTQNYGLPQWEANDPVKREDFNEAFAKVETMGYVVGSYTGNGLTLAEGGLHVELGFHPRFVIISKGVVKAVTSASTFFCTEYPNEGAEYYSTLDETGFKVGLYTEVTNPIKINTVDTVYSFVAFR